jgi:toxin CcdB
MAQFSVYRNGATSSIHIPYLLDVQSGLLDQLETRVVVPLYRLDAFKGKALTRLTPIFMIEGERVLMMTPELSGISRKQLGSELLSMGQHHDEIIAALDMLISGI